ncbi:MAG: hypothetical protein CM15mP59_5610 [Flavobacteriaceae bacterium]|nr:MAG: hypothetical protein CM15mP59_5610 [Flavobacteriaceae bacterium]
MLSTTWINVATNVANVNNVGTNIAKVNSVAAVLGGTQKLLVVTVSGGVFYIDGQSNPALLIASEVSIYTFDVSDSSK